ncbi:MAG: hypothetical protein JW807_08955 [Spirochaetes bacterium]|nr:hypothetical protein [Spirochaetota bacterium]
MKRILIFVMLCAFIVGCRTFDVVVKKDPFKGSTVVSADMWHKVTDSRIFDNQRFAYEKEIRNGKTLIPTAFFLFQAYIVPLWGYNGEDLEKNIFLVCDSKNFKVRMSEYNKVERTDVSGGGRTDSSGNYRSSVSTTRVCTITGKFQLTPEIQQAISKCSKYMIRFYLVGVNNPITLEATPAQLEAVKKFIATNASNIK